MDDGRGTGWYRVKPVNARSSMPRVCAGAILLTVLGAPLASMDLPAPVPGYPVGWCIRTNAAAFADAKSAGFEYVDLAMQDVLGLSDQDFDALRGHMKGLGLDAIAGYNAIPADVRLVGPDKNESLQSEQVARVLERAKALTVEHIILNSGPSWRVPDGGDRDTAFDALVAFGQRFAREAERAGIGILVGPVRSTDSNMITTIAEAIRLVETVNRPNFALMVDYSFLRIQKDDIATLRKAGKLLRHVHIANPEGGRTYPLDAGESDYASFFGVLKDIGYRGGMSVHARTSAFTTDAPRAITFLRGQASRLKESRDR
jgi:D-psicose/D-tagatose/L-ribulose 3-epimerase